MSFESLPSEILLLICNNLDTADLNALTRTCSLMSNMLDSLLYQQAVKSDEYKTKFKFLYAVIYRQANAVSKFFKAGVLMSAFEDYTDDVHLVRRHSRCSVVEKRDALTRNFHPLLAAAYFGNIDVTRVLLNEGNANVDFRDRLCKTALHCAIEADHPDMIKLLVEKGAKMEAFNKVAEVKAPFVHAAKFGNKNAVELMFDELQLQNRGNQIELCGPQNAISDESIKSLFEVACFEACREGHFDIVHFLLDQGVDANLSVRHRGLPYLVTTGRNIPMINLLLRYGARMECERDCGIVTLLSSCGRWQDTGGSAGVDIVLYLLRSGCNVANGGIHACALWRIAKLSGSRGHMYYRTLQ